MNISKIVKLTSVLCLFGMYQSVHAATFSFQTAVRGGAGACGDPHMCYTMTYNFSGSLNHSSYAVGDTIQVSGVFNTGNCTNGASNLPAGLGVVNNANGASADLLPYTNPNPVPRSTTFSAGNSAIQSSVSFYGANSGNYGVPSMGAIGYSVTPPRVCVGFSQGCSLPTINYQYMTSEVAPPAPTPIDNIGSGSIGDAGCFTAGTKVLLADGYTTKPIEEVKTGEFIMTSGGPEEVMKKYAIKYRGLVYAFNGDGNFFVTPTHPFMTTEGWKSLDPEGTRKESPGIKVSLLQTGDTLILEYGKKKTLSRIDAKEMVTTVYNFGLNGTHDYYADGYLVHNVNLGLVERAYALQIMKP